MKQAENPSEVLEQFLSWEAECEKSYKEASAAMMQEERRLQDLLHELEFSQNQKECSKVAARLRQSRKLRRKYKDIVKRNEMVVKFFEEQSSRGMLKRMKQLAGRQRTEEQYLDGERLYKPRMEQGKLGDGKT